MTGAMCMFALEAGQQKFAGTVNLVYTRRTVRQAYGFNAVRAAGVSIRSPGIFIARTWSPSGSSPWFAEDLLTPDLQSPIESGLLSDLQIMFESEAITTNPGDRWGKPSADNGSNNPGTLSLNTWLEFDSTGYRFALVQSTGASRSAGTLRVRIRDKHTLEELGNAQFYFEIDTR